MKRRIPIGSFSGLNFTIWTAKIDRTTQVSSCELAYRELKNHDDDFADDDRK